MEAESVITNSPTFFSISPAEENKVYYQYKSNSNKPKLLSAARQKLLASKLYSFLIWI